jgi:hypothetical protein
MKGVVFNFNARNRAAPAQASFNSGMKKTETQTRSASQALKNFTLRAAGFKKQMQGAEMVTNKVTRANGSMMRGMSMNRRVIQGVGMQVSDFAVQMAGGQNAILAFTQNVPQVVQMFGAWGGVLAGLITVLGTLTLVLYNSGGAINDLLPMTGVLRSDFEALGRIVNDVKEIFFDFANLVVNNLDVILISVTILGTYMAGKWVFSFIAAKGAVMSLVGALNFLKAALIKTGMGALIVLLGYAVERTLALKQQIGDTGQTFALLSEVVREALSNIRQYLEALLYFNSGVWLAIFSVATDKLADLVNWTKDIFLNKMIGAFVGMGGVIVGIFEGLWVGIRNAFAEGWNATVDALTGPISKFEEKIVSLRRRLGIKIDYEPMDFSGAKIDINESAQIGTRIKENFEKAFNQDYIGDLGQDLKGISQEAGRASENMMTAGNNIIEAVVQVSPKLRELMERMRAIKEESIDIRDVFGSGKEDEEGGGKDKKGGDPFGLGQIMRGIKDMVSEAKKAAEEVMSKFEEMQNAISQTMLQSFKGVLSGTESIGDAAIKVLDSIIEKTIDLLMQPIFDEIAGNISGNIFKSVGGGINGSGGFFPSFDGGGYTGKGVRAGGLDGKGGRMAILHPNETVTDHSKGDGTSGPTTVNINLNGVTDFESFEKSRRQLKAEAALLARSVG